MGLVASTEVVSEHHTETVSEHHFCKRGIILCWGGDDPNCAHYDPKGVCIGVIWGEAPKTVVAAVAVDSTLKDD